MTKQRFKIIPACYLVLNDQKGRILMLRRYNTGWGDGNYSLVAGHLDGGETFTQAMVREAKEEAGIVLAPRDLKVVQVMHRYALPNPPDLIERIDVFLSTHKWQGMPVNQEPEKCDDLDWFPIEELPFNTIPFIRQAIDNIRKSVFYSEFGFSKI